MNKPYRALNYVKKFQCTGPECEDTCCQGWRVNLYEDDFHKLRRLFQDNDNMRNYLLSLDLHTEDKRTENDYAALAFGNENHCPMLDDGWCVLHRDHGETMLPRVCATFPKNIIELEERVEVHGMLACPEMVRLCITATEPPALEELPTECFPQFSEQSTFTSQDPDLYQRYMPQVVENVVWILGREGFDERSKNYLISYLLKRISPFFRQGVERDPQKRLNSIFQRIKSPGFFEKTLKGLQPPTRWSTTLVQLVVGVVNATFKGERRKRYQDVCKTVLGSYGDVGNEILRFRNLDSGRLTVLWRSFLERREQVLAVFGDRVERYFLNLSANFWSQSLYQSYSQPDYTACEFALYHSVLRFLFISHPQVLALTEDPQNPKTGPQLDEIMVDVTQPFMKHIGANMELVKSIVQGMDEAKLSDLTSLGVLLQV